MTTALPPLLKTSPATTGITGKIHLTVRSLHDLGALIAQTRKARTYSQQELADIAGVGRRFLSELEGGKATAEIGKVLQVLTALGIDVELKVR
jgi:HTH-type transcriptional regulator/antitoxin HipB